MSHIVYAIGASYISKCLIALKFVLNVFSLFVHKSIPFAEEKCFNLIRARTKSINDNIVSTSY